MEEEVARAGQAPGLGRGEQLDGRVTGLDLAEQGLGGGEGVFAVAAVTEHGGCLGGVEQGQAGEDLASGGYGFSANRVTAAND